MTDDLDRWLSNEPTIRPSSSFVASVMTSVACDAAPPPIPFPWRRALPAAGAALALSIVFALSPVSLVSPAGFSAAIDAVVRVASTPAVMWTAIGLLASAASVATTIRAAR